MAKLDIPVHQKAAKGNAWFAAGLTVLLASGVGYIIFSDSIADEGWLGVLLSLGLCLWIFSFLISWVARLFRFSKFVGPLLTLTDKGIISHWETPPRTLVWDDIEFTAWKTSHGVSVLRVVPKNKGFRYHLRSIFGLPLLDYPTQYLAIPSDEIAQFILDHAPDEIIR